MKPLAKPGWMKRAVLAWLWEWVLLLVLVVIHLSLDPSPTVKTFMYYAFMILFIAVMLPWVLEDKFPWEMWKERHSRELD